MSARRLVKVDGPAHPEHIQSSLVTVEAGHALKICKKCDDCGHPIKQDEFWPKLAGKGQEPQALSLIHI